MTLGKERVEALASNILECHDVKPSEVKALAGLALLALRERAEPVTAPDLHKVIYHFRDLNEGFPVERFKADYVISWMLANYPPAPPAPVVPVETFEEWSRRCEIQLTLCRPEFREVAEITWNACCAAMLAAPGKDG
ncbi:hypothetical protein SOJ77_002866 [Cronobacter sakazakii]|nr:hypothetical protein [Cronobacter sakazakii]ELY6406466.1 hypothetical protein [Cronobacter sakazakii]ELY7498490.1 hypothetical protein [Cronobacter sakazakii]